MGETKININVAYISDENTSLAGMFVFTYLFIRTTPEGPKPEAPEANIKTPETTQCKENPALILYGNSC